MSLTKPCRSGHAVTDHRELRRAAGYPRVPPGIGIARLELLGAHFYRAVEKVAGEVASTNSQGERMMQGERMILAGLTRLSHASCQKRSKCKTSLPIWCELSL